MSTIIGTDLANVLTGTSGNDTITGMGGNDTILGNAGNDNLQGNTGNDNIRGGQGEDLIHGGQDNDTLYGDKGNDTVFGDLGDDYVNGGLDSDILYGGDGNDIMYGNTESNTDPDLDGNDTMYGDAGDDIMQGNKGSDTLDGGIGNDTLNGGQDNDYLYGGEGNNTLYGDNGSDYLYANGGNNTLTGGADADRFTIFRKQNTIDIIQDFEVNNSDEKIDLSQFNSTITNFARLVYWQDGNNTKISLGDNQYLILSNTSAASLSYRNFIGYAGIDASINETINGTPGNDSINGGTGNDTIFGNQGIDLLEGGNGGDVIHGGQDDDTIYGNDIVGTNPEADGDDVIYGDYGNDTIYGNMGNDTLHGGAGSDEIHGGKGDDAIYGHGTESTNLEDDSDDVIFGDLGNDYINGNMGNDTLHGGAGSDEIHGGQGDDTIYGNDSADANSQDDGDDLIFGDKGNDIISGNAGNDIIYGGAGSDTVHGGDGNDTIYGNDTTNPQDDGDDVIYGDAGSDFINGNLGNDTVYGGEGDDTIDGGQGNDALFGDTGNDIITASRGTDTLTGGAGSDLFVISSYPEESNTAIIKDFRQNGDNDKIDVSGHNVTEIANLKITQEGANAVIMLPDGHKVIIENTNKDSLTNYDFINKTYQKVLTVYNVGRPFDDIANSVKSEQVVGKLTTFVIDGFDPKGAANGYYYNTASVIDITRFDIEQVSGLITNNAKGNAVVDLGDGQTLEIRGVKAEQLNETHFITSNETQKGTINQFLSDWDTANETITTKISSAEDTIVNHDGDVVYTAKGNTIIFNNESVTPTSHDITVFNVTTQQGTHVIDNFNSNDPLSKIDLSAFNVDNFNNLLIGQVGDDVVVKIGNNQDLIIRHANTSDITGSSFVFKSQNSTGQPTLSQNSTFANLVYNDGSTTTPVGGFKGDIPDGYQVFADSTEMGISAESLFAVAYINPITGNIVISYRGSSTITDWAVYNRQLSNNILPDNVTLADDFFQHVKHKADKISEEGAGYTISTTGHSLGAFLAQMVAVMNGTKSTVFEMPGAAKFFSLFPDIHPDPNDHIVVQGLSNIVNSLGEVFGKVYSIDAGGNLIAEWLGIDTTAVDKFLTEFANEYPALAPFANLLNPNLIMNLIGASHGMDNTNNAIQDQQKAMEALNKYIHQSEGLVSGYKLIPDSIYKADNIFEAAAYNIIVGHMDPNNLSEPIDAIWKTISPFIGNEDAHGGVNDIPVLSSVYKIDDVVWNSLITTGGNMTYNMITDLLLGKSLDSIIDNLDDALKTTIIQGLESVALESMTSDEIMKYIQTSVSPETILSAIKTGSLDNIALGQAFSNAGYAVALNVVGQAIQGKVDLTDDSQVGDAVALATSSVIGSTVGNVVGAAVVNAVSSTVISNLGTAIGTMILPGIGTIIGLIAGSLITQAIAEPIMDIWEDIADIGEEIWEFIGDPINGIEDIWEKWNDDKWTHYTGNDDANLMHHDSEHAITELKAGDDKFFGWEGWNIVFGAAGNDIIYGGNGTVNVPSATNPFGSEEILPDELYGGEGDDYINGLAANDDIFGGAGSDYLVGGSGNDFITGGDYESRYALLQEGKGARSPGVIGVDGDDIIEGGAGADIIIGGAGEDVASYKTSSSAVTINLGIKDANNIVYGYGGDAEGDRLYEIEGIIGSAFADSLTGDNEQNRIKGGAGNDIISAQQGNDILEGGSGNDEIHGGKGDDVIYGNSSESFNPEDEDNDVIFGDYGNDSIQGNAGNDTIYGGAGADEIHGGKGDDIIYGNDTENPEDDGNDIIFGDLGNDTIQGNIGDDTLYGGAGNDAIHGGQGNDTIYGDSETEAGDDLIYGDLGDDILKGGAGSDVYYFRSGFGKDTIYDTAGIDTIEFEHIAKIEDLSLVKESSDLVISGGSDQITIKDYFAGNKIEQIRFSNGDIFDLSAADELNHAPVATGSIGNLSLVPGSSFSFSIQDSFTDPDGDSLKYSLRKSNGGYAPEWILLNLATMTISGVVPADFKGTLDLVLTADDSYGGKVTQSFSVSNHTITGAGEVIGTTKNDVIFGSVGSDLLSGGDGDDILHYSNDSSWPTGFVAWNVGSPDNQINGEQVVVNPRFRSFDAFDGGAGYDKLIMGNDSDAVFLDDMYSANPIGTNNARLTGVEEIIAGGGNDIVDLTSQQFSYGDVKVSGGEGDDVLWTSSGNDILQGGAGKDNIDGGTGNDVLNGGADADLMFGGLGSDVFEFGSLLDSKNGAYDTIADFTSGQDKIDLAALYTFGIDSFADLTITQNAETNETIITANDTTHPGATDHFELHLKGLVTLQDSDFVW